MGIAFDQDSRVGSASPDKLTVAKQCLQTLTDQLNPRYSETNSCSYKKVDRHCNTLMTLVLVIDCIHCAYSYFTEHGQNRIAIHEPPISWQSHFAPNPFHSDQFGLVRFNQQAEVHCPMKLWRTVNKAQLKREIGTLRPYGATCLSAAIDCATQLFSAAGIKNHSSV